MSRSCEVALIGAGVIGLTVALTLAREGRDVLVLDPGEPGAGASYGNAGTIADYAVMPVGTPEVLRALPQLLFSRTSPLAIRRASILALAPWLLRFLGQSMPRAAERNAQVLVRLLAGAGPAWADLAGGVGAGALLRDRGCLYLYRTQAERREAEAGLARRRGMGVAMELLSPGELAALEPSLPAMEGGAAFFPGAISLSDPGKVMALIAAAAGAEGVRFERLSALAVAEMDGAAAVDTDRGVVHARHVVIAAGAHSRKLARMAGAQVPLDTERGYHLEFDGFEGRLGRPACPVARGFYFCPMQGRLRAAGTVELGGTQAPPSPHRLARLLEGAREVFPDLPEPSRTWMGLRPSMPDSLPVIGRARRGGPILLAFGHGHIGLTLAPVTARIVGDLVAGREPGKSAEGVGVERFR